jgi:hypothetical protein
MTLAYGLHAIGALDAWVDDADTGVMTFSIQRTGTRASRFPGMSRALSSLRETLRRRRADRRAVARQIAAYPATRSAAASVLPASRRDAA